MSIVLRVVIGHLCEFILSVYISYNLRIFIKKIIYLFWLIGYFYLFYRVFRDVPSDITIEVDGAIFLLHKVSLSILVTNPRQIQYLNLMCCRFLSRLKY